MKKDPINATNIASFVCAMIFTGIALVVFTDLRNDANTLEGTFIPQVGIWACLGVLAVMLVYILGFTWTYFKSGRRSRST